MFKIGRTLGYQPETRTLEPHTSCKFWLYAWPLTGQTTNPATESYSPNSLCTPRLSYAGPCTWTSRFGFPMAAASFLLLSSATCWRNNSLRILSSVCARRLRGLDGSSGLSFLTGNMLKVRWGGEGIRVTLSETKHLKWRPRKTSAVFSGKPGEKTGKKSTTRARTGDDNGLEVSFLKQFF